MALRRTDDGYQDPMAWMKGDEQAPGGSMFPDMPVAPTGGVQTTGTPKGGEDRTTPVPDNNVPPPAPPAPPVDEPPPPPEPGGPPKAPGPSVPPAWAPGSSAPPPGAAPPGTKWDPNVAAYVPVNQGADPKGYHWDGTKLVGNSVAPTAGGSRDDILAHIASFASSHPGANPSITRDPGYWAGRIMATHPDGNIDWGYWEMRMMQAEGPPEGVAKPAGTAGNKAPSGYQAPPPSPYSGNPNQVQVGTDPLSQGTNTALMQLLQQGGRLTSPVGQKAYEALNSYLSGGSLNNRLESIREKMALGERATMNDARGQLADRGLLSEGSTAQGPELSTIGRVAQHAGETFAGEARQALVDDDANLMGAIQTATGLDEAAANRLLATVGSVGDRQKMLSDVAARSLEDNMAWNQFLAQYGLDRDKAMYEIQSGQSAQMLPLINAFVSWINATSGGYV